jgi:hypothetical protein
MGWIIVLIIAIILFALAIQYWYVTLSLVLIGFVIYIVVDERDKKKRSRDERAAQLQHHNDEQQECLKRIIALADDSIGLFESMPKCLSRAERSLAQAEADFADGAFAPFWDSIESAATALGRFDECVHRIAVNSSTYTGLVKKHEGTSPPFPITHRAVIKLSIGTEIAERMKATVRSAQRNFQFATIYEHRKTNQILVAGFTSLAQALDRMGWQITASIDGLRASVDAAASATNEMAENASQYHQEVMQESSGRTTRERKALDMLDNIQRHRRPSPFDA